MNVGLIVAILAIVLILQGTKTTGPNPSFMKQVPVIEEIENMPSSNRKRCYELFTELHQKNPGLAEELGRIPEFADNEISDKDLEALVNMSDYFSDIDSKYPDRLDQSFEKILDVGIKDKRKYCSPLRFLFWLAGKYRFDEEEISYGKNPLEYFSLTKLISLGMTQFPEKMSEFTEVVDILSTPELVSLWMKENISYYHDSIRQRPRSTFVRRKGDCEEQAIFASYILQRSGYRTWCLRMWWGGEGQGHTLALFETDRGFWVIDNASRVGLKGPFENKKGVIRFYKDYYRKTAMWYYTVNWMECLDD